MSRRSFAHPLRASLLVLLVGAAACAGEEILGPIDPARCNRGVLDVTTVTNSVVNAADCTVFSDWQFEPALAETWTLRLQPHTGYVIRLLSVEMTPGVSPFRGEIVAYERDASGEAQLVTTGRNFGPNNRHEELVMTTDRARTLALRIETRSPADTGAYRIEVSTCPVRRILPDSVLTGISTAAGCLSEGGFAGPRSRLTFFDFEVDDLDGLLLGYDQLAGSASISGVLAGPDLDLNQSLSSSYRATSSAQEHVFDGTLPLLGRYTAAIRVHADSTATIVVSRSATTLLRSASPR